MDNRLQNRDMDGPEYAEFLSLLQANKKKIFGYILAVLPNYSTAEDIMQDTIIRLWSKFSSFTPGTNFGAWGISVARYVIMEFRRKDKNVHICFDSQAMDNLSVPFETFEDIDGRVEALRHCLKKLPDNQMRMIRMRYSDRMTIKDIALKMSRPIHGMYKFITKIQYALQECIEGTIKAWDTN